MVEEGPTEVEEAVGGDEHWIDVAACDEEAAHLRVGYVDVVRGLLRAQEDHRHLALDVGELVVQPTEQEGYRVERVSHAVVARVPRVRGDQVNG